ncbi:hypothetical protein GCM10022270_04530 [Terriglobus aquaticus]
MSAVISHVPLVSCIHVPRFDTVDAIQRSRKSGYRSGAKPLARVVAGETDGVASGADGFGEIAAELCPCSTV